MAYNKTVWVNGQAPAIDADNLNKIEDALESHDEDISDLKSQITQNSGVPTEVKRAMDTLFSKMGVKDDAGYASTYAVIHEWATAVNLLSISAVFEQGNNIILDIDDLDSLRQYLTVTATYDDGTSTEISSYTLSGTLTEGTSYVTVTEEDKTASFAVIVTGTTDVTPLMSTAVASNYATVTYNSSENSVTVNTTSNQSYQQAKLPITLEKGYTYKVICDVAYVSGDIKLYFYDSTTSKALLSSSTWTDGGTKELVGVPSNNANWSDSTSPTAWLGLCVTWGTKKAGQATFSNLKVVKYLVEA